MLYIDRNQISYVLIYMLHVHISKGSTNAANMLIPGLFFGVLAVPIALCLEGIR